MILFGLLAEKAAKCFSGFSISTVPMRRSVKVMRFSREEIRFALTGPVPTVMIPFRSDGEIDFEGLRRYLDFILDAGAKTVIITYGDSLFSLLTDIEIEEITRTVVDHVSGKAVVVAADRMWWTGKTVEFAKFVVGVGADMLMVLPPDWARSTTPTSLAQHYRAIAAHVPVMIVTNIFSSRSIEFGLETLKILQADATEIVAIKDDWGGLFGRRLGSLAHERWAIITCGKENFIDARVYGCDGYLSNFLEFYPQIAHRFWTLVQLGETADIARLIEEYEVPFFDYIGKVRGGPDAAMHGAFEWAGICGRFRRPPYHTLNDEEMERLSDFLDDLVGRRHLPI